MIRKVLIIIAFLFCCLVGFSQSGSIKIDVRDKPLSDVLVMLRDQYEFQFSYSDNQLSQYKVTVSKSFQSKDNALTYLLKGLPFEVRKSGDVFIIIPVKIDQVVEKRKTLAQIAGQIVEAGSYEPLPFSHILINNHPMVSDVMGSFNYTASADSSFHVRISHLGYYICDTTLFAGINQKFKLIPYSESISEVTVQDNIIEKATLIGEKPGKIKLNHNISRYIPGQGDNSVFNLIRLMPGVLASGEQSTDLLIWGSYEGESLVTFDEFTLFGLKNYNDNISIVNPFLVKNIEIYKGGYEAKYGNRVGGLVNISGKNGNLKRPSLSLNINQTTINAMAEIPLFKVSSLMVAYRQTYYDLYKNANFNIYAPTKPVLKSVNKATLLKRFDFDVDIYPDDYSFRDFNLKYTLNLGQNNNFYLSLYRASDNFVLAAETEVTKKNNNQFDIPFNITIYDKEYNSQRGGTLYYGHTWKNGNSSTLIASHSNFSKDITDSIATENLNTGMKYNNDLNGTNNTVLENSIRNENITNFLNGHYLEFGAGYYYNEASISNVSTIFGSMRIDTTNEFSNSRMVFYLQDNLPVGKKLELKGGMRANYLLTQNKLLFEPRLSASYKLTNNLKVNTSWGIYNQFVYKSASVDENNNFSYLWVTATNKPVLKATHFVVGANYFKNDFTFDIEGFYKTTDNISRRIFESKQLAGGKKIMFFTPYYGDARSFGIDLYMKKDFGRHSVWASYSLSKAQERLANSGQLLGEYVPAPHDQRHELKVAALFNIRKFYLSANYVYGSGLQLLKEKFADEVDDIYYSRLDAAVTYKFAIKKKLNCETGVSVINVFDTQNLKLDNLKRIKISPEYGDITIYSNAVPFSPTLFLKMVF
jgi:hypothetical protein